VALLAYLVETAGNEKAQRPKKARRSGWIEQVGVPAPNGLIAICKSALAPTGRMSLLTKANRRQALAPMVQQVVTIAGLKGGTGKNVNGVNLARSGVQADPPASD